MNIDLNIIEKMVQGRHLARWRRHMHGHSVDLRVGYENCVGLRSQI